MSTNHLFTVAGNPPIDLDVVADELRKKIDGMTGDSLLAAQQLAPPQSGAVEYLVVVRTHENPHSHAKGDLIVCILEGGGYFQLDDGATADAPAGSVVVIPKGVCHAFHNTSDGDSVVFASFSPEHSTDPCAETSSGAKPEMEEHVQS